LDSNSPGGGKVGSVVGDNNAFNPAYPMTKFFKIGTRRSSVNMPYLRTTNMICEYMISPTDNEMFPGLNAILRSDLIRDVEFKAFYVYMVRCVH
jgi:hypothetical protein